ncbi:peptidase T [Flavipsychrobacter stenotrophus]|uniref:Peptidase T n=1 Tax=Flavipsychrobacter stenotrophus TaxID=2077091 RepID=A0A2S7SX70_9BACT|nr:peptidase T [Flavipsychrobacter stenotrophus]PQJ11207.1 peptidase T [Flavipsychrobacter stenotrophus]
MALANYNHTAAERFMRYVQVDTQSDPMSPSQPSTEKQKDLSRILVKELLEIGLTDAELDEHGYVYATIPANTDKNVPVLCFCSHVDTAPDCSGEGVKPILHKNYDGKDITLPDDNTIVVSAKDHPYLKERIGDDIITASGLTLLGADDKAGVAIIMDLAHYLMNNPEVKHGKIRMLFTPDEEVGRGVAAIDMKKLGADFGYTLDGGERGHLEGESFSADAAVVTFHGVSAHPGYAKGKMVSAIKAASAFVSMLPDTEWCPEATEGMQGFVHPTSITGELETAVVKFIVRDFDTKKLAEHEARLKGLAEQAAAKFPGTTIAFEVKEQYRNMKEVLDLNPQVMGYAEEAYGRAGMKANIQSIRGGTDGSRLSFMGLPCPNLFTGEMGIHSKQEYVSVQDMEKATEVLVHLAQIWAEK